MKLSTIINYPLRLFGIKLARIDRLKFINNEDLQQEKEFLAIYDKIKDHTLVPFERCFTLYKAVQYIIKNNIPGDLVECGVWKGGSCMLIAYALLEAGITNRKIWLYDTFAGMTEPGEKDGAAEKEEWKKGVVSTSKNNMSYAPPEVVKANMQMTGYPAENIIYIKGNVEETIPTQTPSAISLLRLDTDWYASTMHELKHLYPLLSQKSILIIDDYGSWQGAKKATDEYFADKGVYLQRIDRGGRLVIKT